MGSACLESCAGVYSEWFAACVVQGPLFPPGPAWTDLTALNNGSTYASMVAFNTSCQACVHHYPNLTSICQINVTEEAP